MGELTIVTTTDGYLVKDDVSYAAAQAATPSVYDVQNVILVGQNNYGRYAIYRSYIRFNTGLGAGASLISSLLKLKTETDYSDTNFNMVGSVHDWGVSLEAVDWDASPGSDFSYAIDTPDLVEIDISSITNTSGETRLELRSDREGTSPTGNEAVRFHSRDAANESYRPRVVIHWNYAPLAPSGLAPASTVIPFDETNAFSWTFNDNDAEDTQLAFQLQIIRVSDGVTVLDTGKFTASYHSFTVGSGVLAQGVQYQWRVKTWDNHNTEGAWSAYATITAKDKPTCTITSPAHGGAYGKSIMTVDWAFADTDADTQAQYQAILKTAAGVTIEDSGWQVSEAATHTFSTLVTDGTSYKVTVNVKDTDGLTGADTNDFTADYVPPPIPTITVTDM